MHAVHGQSIGTMHMLCKKTVRLTVVITCAFHLSSVQADPGENGGDITLNAPDGSSAVILRDSYGAPHITGESEIGVFFAQGFAAAHDRLSQLEQFRAYALGRSAEIQGPDYVEVDTWIRTLFYTEKERREQFNALPSSLKDMMGAYCDGINAYLDSLAVNPNTYMPMDYILLLSQRTGIEPWTVTHSVAILQTMMRVFGQFGGEELARVLELQTYGKKWFDRHRPINDPDARDFPSGIYFYRIEAGSFVETRKLLLMK